MYDRNGYYQKTGTNTTDNDYRRSTYSNYQQAYADGNTVRRYVAAPDNDDYDDCSEIQKKIRENRKREMAREERARASRLRRLEHSKGLNLVTCITMVGIVMVMLSLCINILQMKSDITGKSKEIVTKQAELNKLKAKNDSLKMEVEASIDTDEIFKIATKELGMVFANKNQIIKYQGSESAYVRQYEDVPEDEKDDIYKDVLSTLK